MGYRLWSFIANSAWIAFGSALFAFALQFLVIPHEFMEGGVTGIALLLKYGLNIPPWLTLLLFNVPLLILGWRWTGATGVAYTIVGSSAFTLFLWIAEGLAHRGWLLPLRVEDDFLLAALYAGLTTGLGLGIVLRYGGSTGGTMLLARLAQRLFGWKYGHVILFFDVLVIGVSVFFLPMENVLYTLIMAFVSSKVIDFITQAAYSAKAITVFTKLSAPLAERLLRDTERGLTLYQARGGYTGDEMEVLYCVVSRSELNRFKNIVKTVDPMAFMTVHDVQEVLGEGFQAHG
jgi:uncharacterized membrane-anchored protein YitT (DUF2179 family)